MRRQFRTAVAAAFLAASSGLAPAALAQPTPDFGDDASRWANDGECDDKRFTGAGMTSTLLLDSDVGHDASDCRDAWRSGQVRLAPADSLGREYDTPEGLDTPDFGDDASEWAEDGECDDPRFAGPDMTETTLLDEDIGHDASDCRAAWEAGGIRLIGADVGLGDDDVDFGDDASQWANDGECDDPRFTGPGMTGTTLLQSDILHDATDCRTAWNAGRLELR